MKPIDAVTGLPRSPDVAKLADTAARQGETQSQLQSVSFSKEVAEKARSVPQSHKTEKAKIGNGSQDSHGSAGGSLPGKGQRGDEEGNRKESPHPSKGQIIDIRGA
ncbi:MAG TPA: hypothetical protein GX529_04285 [Firmicutes bacterium]|nr:hypothetical protein [Candidatus Fermentithermobacillaceae bacterium]